MTQLPLPFGDSRSHLPRRFRSRRHFEAEWNKYYPDKHAAPTNHELIGSFAGGRFIIAATRFPPHNTEYIVGYYRHGMSWAPVSTFPVYEAARWYRNALAGLSHDEMLKALWLLHKRPAVPSIWIPAEARLWNDLNDMEQELVWSLIQAGAPGRISEVIEAGRACGLY